MTDDGPEPRPSPELLLQQANREGRGRLKIFLGAAPGVGKTYEMLTSARRRRLDGVDVVVGVVETHGRIETDLLTKGFEVIPKKRMLYRGQVMAEMDLDAILQRHPTLVLVDELAHTNVDGSRHPKRYMDVEELLAAGIDVYSTLNIQHLESVKDVVAKITHVVVRESVPDSILDRADEIEVVDITPEDLIQRLKEGKVYIPEQAERAIRNYFTEGNLTALRELALRRTAQRVDEQMLNYMQTHAIAGPWETSDRVLACISEDRGSAALVRYARRLADRLHAPWTVLYVETPETRQLSEADRDYIAECQRMAERLGGISVSIPAAERAHAVVNYAQTNNFTHIVISRTKRPWWVDLFRRSTVAQLIREARDINVHVMADHSEHAPAGRREPRNFVQAQSFAAGWRQFAGAAAWSVAALLAGLVLRQFLGIANIALVFLTGVLASAVTYGLGPALLACVLSVLAFNFFFIPPLYTFTIADPENVIALISFAIVAVIGSNLTARLRLQAITAQGRAKTTEDLYAFSRKLTGIVSLDDLLWATSFQIASMLRVRVVILLPEGETLTVRSGYPPEDILSDADIAAAKWSWQNNLAAGRGADTLPGAKRLFIPLRTGRGAVGVVGLDNDRPGPLLSPDQRRLLDSLAGQAALAIERIQLAADVDKSRMAMETEKLRSALLTSISHDLKTPLASILGSATSLRSYRRQLDDAAQEELLRTIQEESERLQRFITNLLDMTRLESGAIAPNRQLIDVSDVVATALNRAVRILSGRHVMLDIASDVPMLRLDPVLLEQVLFNLVDNAAKYAPGNSDIRIRGWREHNLVRLSVMDEGTGIPAADVERIFDKFYRVHATDRKTAGTGLGLAVCRGFVEAMGGTITAGNRTDRAGAIFTISFPVPVDEPAQAPEPA
jgi:two-component system, OmpR family, sensor histidine kinase KdpD